MTGDVSAELKDAMRTLRELELHLNFFNLGFANVLWGCKVLLLNVTILSGFSAIRLIHTNPVLGFLYGYICYTCIIIYIGMYQFAYKVTEKREDLKRKMDIVSGESVSPEERKYWTKVLRSIPRMGMNLGGFNRVEREAVPICETNCVPPPRSQLIHELGRVNAAKLCFLSLS